MQLEKQPTASPPQVSGSASSGQLVIPVSSVPYERGLSVQNHIKTQARNRLSEDHVTCLMALHIHGKTVEQFDFDTTVTHFTRMKKQRK